MLWIVLRGGVNPLQEENGLVPFDDLAGLHRGRLNGHKSKFSLSINKIDPAYCCYSPASPIKTETILR